jgi:hypothetical protein
MLCQGNTLEKTILNTSDYLCSLHALLLFPFISAISVMHHPCLLQCLVHMVPSRLPMLVAHIPTLFTTVAY